jgi:hypothetical protein
MAIPRSAKRCWAVGIKKSAQALSNLALPGSPGSFSEQRWLTPDVRFSLHAQVEVLYEYK